MKETGGREKRRIEEWVKGEIEETIARERGRKGRADRGMEGEMERGKIIRNKGVRQRLGKDPER